MTCPTAPINQRPWLAIAVLVCLILLTGCTASPFVLTFLPPTPLEPPSPLKPLEPLDGLVPTIKPVLNANVPVDYRQNILEELDAVGVPVVIGQSVRGADISAFRFGKGPTSVVIVGGIHGGYEANTVRLMNRFVEGLQDDASIVPEQVSLYMIPAMNPDGFTKRGLPGRVNANRVDLNRNWGCNWDKSSGFYRDAFYRTGARAFSEPESRAVRNFVDYVDGKIAVFYHSHGGFIFYGDCNDDNGSRDLARSLSLAIGFPVWNPSHSLGDPNQPTITGDATDYLDQIGVQAIGIELPMFQEREIDWQRSYAGLLQILAYAEGLE